MLRNKSRGEVGSGAAAGGLAGRWLVVNNCFNLHHWAFFGFIFLSFCLFLSFPCFVSLLTKFVIYASCSAYEEQLSLLKVN